MLNVAVTLAQSEQVGVNALVVPRVVAPSRKVTVPARVLPLEATGVIVAVKITDCPVLDGFGEDVVVVVVWFTVKLSMEDVLVKKFASPV